MVKERMKRIPSIVSSCASLIVWFFIELYSFEYFPHCLNLCSFSLYCCRDSHRGVFVVDVETRTLLFLLFKSFLFVLASMAGLFVERFVTLELVDIKCIFVLYFHA